jgi:hypothetical protein
VLCSLGRPLCFADGMWGFRHSHSGSDRSLGYLLLAMRRRVGDHQTTFSDSLSTGLLGNPYLVSCALRALICPRKEAFARG